MDDREWDKVARVLDRLVPDMQILANPLGDGLLVRLKTTDRDIHIQEGTALDLAEICRDISMKEVQMSVAGSQHAVAMQKLGNLMLDRAVLQQNLKTRMSKEISGKAGKELDNILDRAKYRATKREDNGGA